MATIEQWEREGNWTDVFVIIVHGQVESVWTDLDRAKRETGRLSKKIGVDQLHWKWVVRKLRWEARVKEDDRQPVASIVRRALDYPLLVVGEEYTEPEA